MAIEDLACGSERHTLYRCIIKPYPWNRCNFTHQSYQWFLRPKNQNKKRRQALSTTCSNQIGEPRCRSSIPPPPLPSPPFPCRNYALLKSASSPAPAPSFCQAADTNEAPLGVQVALTPSRDFSRDLGTLIWGQVLTWRFSSLQNGSRNYHVKKKSNIYASLKWCDSVRMLDFSRSFSSRTQYFFPSLPLPFLGVDCI